MNTVDVTVVTAQEVLYKGKCSMVVATTVHGEIGVKPKHTPFLGILKPGQATIHTDAGEIEIYYVSGGVIEVQPNMVTILADDAQRAKDIDEAKAQKARSDAAKLLAGKEKSVDFAKLQVELAKSIAQISALRKFKKHVEKRRS